LPNKGKAYPFLASSSLTSKDEAEIEELNLAFYEQGL